MKKIIYLASFLSAPAVAFAHAGDHKVQPLVHYIESPFHLWPILAVVVLLTVWLLKRNYSGK